MHKIFIFIILFTSFLSGCSTSKTITFRVLDAETNHTIEGAVGIAMWTKARGLPGLSSSYTAKAIEAVSDGKGDLIFLGVDGYYAHHKPHVKIYKPGYVGWDSILIYLGHHPKDLKLPIYKSREDFSWSDQDICLEPWMDEYSYISHGMFIDVPGDISKAGIEESNYNKAIRYEGPLRAQERRKISQ